MKPWILGLVAVSTACAEPQFVDMRTVMKLAGGSHDEVELARRKHAEALLESNQAWQRYWPNPVVGAQYRGHEGRTQDVKGAVFDVSKQQYFAGGGVVVDWAPGDIYFAALASKQRAVAAGHAVDKARLDTMREAAERYYELLAAESSLSIIANDLVVTQKYASQLESAVQVGTVFRGDFLRVQTQLSRLRLQIRQGEENTEVCAARLAETLRLGGESALRAAKVDLIPVTLVGDLKLGDLLARAQASRPELKSLAAADEALRREEQRVRVGPWFPSFQAGYSTGGFGGGQGSGFGNQQDYYAGLGWKVGPGGLFDSTRPKIVALERESSQFRMKKAAAMVEREVVEMVAHVRSAKEQIQIAEDAVAAAEELTKISGERQANQVGVVLEYVIAREDLTRSRLARVRAVVDYNRAQHLLEFALGVGGS